MALAIAVGVAGSMVADVQLALAWWLVQLWWQQSR
jgi:hypothetical protein